MKRYIGFLLTLALFSSQAFAVIDWKDREIKGQLTVRGNTAVEGLSVNDSLEFDQTTNSSATGSAQDVTLTTPVTVFTNASLTSIRNITAGSGLNDSTVIWIKNGKSSGNLTLVENTGGTAANRIITGAGFDLDLEPGQMVSLVYDANATRWQVSGGSGGGGATTAGQNNHREYITNGTFEKPNSNGWSAYADSAATTPVDGTGGSPAITVGRTTTAGQVRRQTGSLIITKDAANRQGQGASFDFTIDPQDAEASRAIFVQFDYAMPSNYADNDMAVFVRDTTANTDIPCRGFTGETSAPLAPIKKAASGSNGKFACVFYPQTAANLNYRLIFHQSSTSALGYSLYLDSVHVGPSALGPSYFGSEWTTQTCTTSWASNATVTCKSRRVGDEEEFFFNIATTGVPTNTSLSLNLPNGWLIDTAKIPGTVSSETYISGSGGSLDASVSTYPGFSVRYLSTSSVLLIAPQVNAAAAGNVPATGNAVAYNYPFSYNAGDQVWATFKVPITNRAASNMLSTTEVNLQNPAGAPTTAGSGIKTPPATDRWLQMTSNSLTLPSGTHDLTGDCNLASSGGSATYSQLICGWYAANGADTTTEPALLSTVATVLNKNAPYFTRLTGLSSSEVIIAAPALKIRCTSACTVYLVAYTAMSTPANARVTNFLSAARQPDFSVFGTYSRDRVERARIAYGSACSSSPCTINNQSNSWLTSVTRSGTGSYTFNFTGFTDIPACNVNVGGGNFYVVITGQTASTLAIDTRVTSTTSNSDAANMNVICMGPQ